MNGITTHILDVSRGLPAPHVVVRLEMGTANEWKMLAEAITDADGRARLIESAEMETGNYRLTFEVASYFDSTATLAFYPTIQIVFTVRETRHHHVPLLLSPFGYSTYRGS